MNKTLRNALLVISALVLAGIIFLAGTWYSRMNGFGPFNMMDGYRYNNKAVNSPFMFRGNNSMMGNRQGSGMMGGNGNMMNGFGYNNANTTPITVDQARTAAENYLANLDNTDLEIAEVMVFDNNAYILVSEISTAKGAFELLADSSSIIAYPEHGPNMMWNLKYGNLNHQSMMNGHGMMNSNYWNGAVQSDVTVEMTVSSEQAIEYAQQYLDANIDGATAAMDPITFYGYYTLDYEIDGEVAGMLSVNGYTGQVFVHTWHGNFIEETQIN